MFFLELRTELRDPLSVNICAIPEDFIREGNSFDPMLYHETLNLFTNGNRSSSELPPVSPSVLAEKGSKKAVVTSKWASIAAANNARESLSSNSWNV